MTLRAPNTPEAAFLVIGALAGVLFILLTPPFGGADEPAHWYRAYQVSEGTFRCLSPSYWEQSCEWSEQWRAGLSLEAVAARYRDLLETLWAGS